MYKEGDTVTYNNYKEMVIIGIIIPNTIFEIKDPKTNSVHVVSHKDIKPNKKRGTIMKTFINLEELRKRDKDLAIELIQAHGEDNWVDEVLIYYPTLSSYAKHELTDGWYSEALGDRDWNGAPNPVDHINLESLGKDLSTKWDEGSYYLSSRGEVIETVHGWESL